MTYEVGILCHLHMSFYYRGHLLNIPTLCMKAVSYTHLTLPTILRV